VPVVAGWVPNWWGLVAAKMDQVLALEPYKDAGQNPTFDVGSRLDLLWVPEAVRILRRFGVKGSFYKGSAAKRLAEVLNEDQARIEVCRALRERVYHTWRKAAC